MAGSKKGERRGGRQKGVTNKKRQALIDQAEKIGVDPFEVLLLYAGNKWKKLGHPGLTDDDGKEHARYPISFTDQIQAAKEACQYLHPKRRSIEIDETNPLLTGEKLIVDLRWEDDEDSAQPKEKNATAKKNS